MKLEGTILPVSRDRVLRRDDTRLPSAWVRRPVEAPDLGKLDWFCEGRPSNSPRAPADGPLLVMLGPGDGPSETLRREAHAGRRVYLLVTPERALPSEVVRAPAVLIRRCAALPASAILAGDKATLWLSARWRVQLDAAQARALRQVFLHLFWHEATEEAFSGVGKAVWGAASERPFDVAMPPLDASVRLFDDVTSSRIERDLMHVKEGPSPKRAGTRGWLPVGPDHHGALAELVRAGTEVVWGDLDLPEMALDDEGGEIFLPAVDGRSLGLRLNSAQRAEGARILRQPAPWMFGVDLRIGAEDPAKAEFWLPGEGAPRHLEEEQSVDLGAITARSLGDFADTSPASLPQAQPLALSIRYRWRVLPPYPPSGALEDPLHRSWRDLDELYSARAEAVRGALEVAEQEAGRLTALSRLASQLLGFKRGRRAHEQELSELAGRRPSQVGPSDASELLSRLTEVESKTQGHHEELAEAERKAREEEERERQETEWRAAVDRAKRALPELREKLDVERGRLKDVLESLDNVEAEKANAGKRDKKKLRAQAARFGDDCKAVNKEIRRLEGEICANEQTIAEPFQFSPPSAGLPRKKKAKLGRFIPKSTTTAAASVPDEALPAVGQLYRHKKQRYLVIPTWESWRPGVPEADRLCATLVAAKDG